MSLENTRTISDDVGTRLLFENDRVRVWDLRLEPGESTGLHRHTSDFLYIVIGDGTLQTTFADGVREAPNRQGRAAAGGAGPLRGAECTPPFLNEARFEHYQLEFCSTTRYPSGSSKVLPIWSQKGLNALTGSYPARSRRATAAFHFSESGK